jgi:hypothetical protein
MSQFQHTDQGFTSYPLQFYKNIVAIGISNLSSPSGTGRIIGIIFPYRK